MLTLFHRAEDGDSEEEDEEDEDGGEEVRVFLLFHFSLRSLRNVADSWTGFWPLFDLFPLVLLVVQERDSCRAGRLPCSRLGLKPDSI